MRETGLTKYSHEDGGTIGGIRYAPLTRGYSHEGYLGMKDDIGGDKRQNKEEHGS